MTSVRTVNTRRSAKQFARGLRGGILTTSMPAPRQDRVERRRELPGAIAHEEPEPGGVLAEVHQQIAGLLGGPGPVGMRGHAQDVQGAVADFECEQDVEPPQCHCAIDVEEVHRERAAGLGAQEPPLLQPHPQRPVDELADLSG